MNTIKKKLVLNCTIREERQQCDEPELAGPLPRITRLMALAIRCDELLRTGKVRDLEHLATIGNVSQPRISQILSLTMLAPDIQETLLFLSRLSKGKAEIHEKRLRPIAAMLRWEDQRKAWRRICDEVGLKRDARAESTNQI
ncbi:hypothetical protein SH449x_002680 [Pirellulaceae bacterium SH449]